jgi:hypothetical protein
VGRGDKRGLGGYWTGYKFISSSIIRASINRASLPVCSSSPLSVRGRSCEWIAIRISTPEKKMASERVNKRKRVVLNNVF